MKPPAVSYIWEVVTARGRHDEAKPRMVFVLFVSFALFASHDRGLDDLFVLFVLCRCTA